MRLNFAAATIALLALSGAAWAQQPGPGGGLRMLDQADANHDGAISRDEISASRAAAFTRLDANGDGYVSEDERPNRGAQGGQRQGRGMARADANNDGRLSRDEFVNQPMPGLERFDANRDGALDATELQAARDAARRLRG